MIAQHRRLLLAGHGRLLDDSGRREALHQIPPPPPTPSPPGRWCLGRRCQVPEPVLGDSHDQGRRGGVQPDMAIVRGLLGLPSGAGVAALPRRVSLRAPLHGPPLRTRTLKTPLSSVRACCTHLDLPGTNCSIESAVAAAGQLLDLGVGSPPAVILRPVLRKSFQVLRTHPGHPVVPDHREPPGVRPGGHICLGQSQPVGGLGRTHPAGRVRRHPSSCTHTQITSRRMRHRDVIQPGHGRTRVRISLVTAGARSARATVASKPSGRRQHRNVRGDKYRPARDVPCLPS